MNYILFLIKNKKKIKYKNKNINYKYKCISNKKINKLLYYKLLYPLKLLIKQFKKSFIYFRKLFLCK